MERLKGFGFELNGTRVLIALLAAVSLANTACSTPPVPNHTNEDREIAWWAYQECVQNLPRGVSPTACDNVNSSRTLTRYQYVNGGYYSTSSGGYYKAGSSFDERLLDQSYKSYLDTLDADSLKEMTAKWKALSEQGE